MPVSAVRRWMRPPEAASATTFSSSWRTTQMGLCVALTAHTSCRVLHAQQLAKPLAGLGRRRFPGFPGSPGRWPSPGRGGLPPLWWRTRGRAADPPTGVARAGLDGQAMGLWGPKKMVSQKRNGNTWVLAIRSNNLNEYSSSPPPR